MKAAAPSWTVVHELARIDEASLTKMFEAGEVTADMTAKDVRSKSAAKQPRKSDNPSAEDYKPPSAEGHKPDEPEEGEPEGRQAGWVGE